MNPHKNRRILVIDDNRSIHADFHKILSPGVICMAYSEYSWDEISAQIGNSNRMAFLKKPFDTVEALHWRMR